MSLELFHHKPMGLHGGTPLKVPTRSKQASQDLGYWDLGPMKSGYWDMGPLKLGYLGYRDPPLHTPINSGKQSRKTFPSH